MRRVGDSICAGLLCVYLTFVLLAQPAAKTTVTVPRLVKFSGALADAAGKHLSGMVGVTFALYEEERGGAPLWMETQNVQADGNGRYTAMLGSTRNDGIPAEVFASGQGRWLGVQPLGEMERPRVLLVSVPYALKAADAETLGGLPASAFALAGAGDRGTAGGEISEPPGGPLKPRTAEAAIPDQTGSGTTNYITIWTGPTTLGNSKLYQAASGNVGLGTTTPSARLEAISASATGSGMLGISSATTGANFGVTGRSVSPAGTGVLGAATATSGTNYGVYGNTASPAGVGVFGMNTAVSGGNGVYGQSAATAGNGVFGIDTATSGFAVGVNGQTNSPSGTGVNGLNLATTGGNAGVFTSMATSGFANGVNGQSASTSGNGVLGINTATSGFAVGVNGGTASPGGTGVNGQNLATNGGNGVQGEANATSGFANGVSGQSASPSGNGVWGSNTATSGAANGVNGQTASPTGNGVNGVNTATTGGNGGNFTSNATSGFANGVYAQTSSTSGNGVSGFDTATSGFAIGVSGSTNSPGGAGVFGFNNSSGGFGLDGQAGASGVAVFGVNQTCTGSGCSLVNGTAGEFVTGAGGIVLQGIGGGNQVFYVDGAGNGFLAGNLNVNGKVTKGSGSFKIDHPLDPANKYLSHSFVESPDMMDVYNGVIRLDAKGEAWVSLPDYFEALNGDFRYQLTAIGAPAPRLYIAREVTQNRFKIAGGRPGGRVSWQVTGIRHDAYANVHRIPVTEEKPSAEQGTYLHPDVFGHGVQSGASASPASAGLPE